jgi:hypothetical protein
LTVSEFGAPATVNNQVTSEPKLHTSRDPDRSTTLGQVICSHCAKSLLRRERTGRRSPACRREFALEPKESPARMHDLRMRRLTEKLGDGRGLRYTPTQLW